jgi:chitin disaccharide deacetylase
VTSIAVIVNADDLGIDQDVNEATFDLMARGRVTSATIMANAPATREAARRASQVSGCSFGVHLNVTQFEPLTGGPGARLLVDERGQMSRANEDAPPTPPLLRAVYRELCAQIERVAALGVRITHLDSHHHVHTRACFFPVLKEVQRRYRIRRVRLTKNFYSPGRRCPADLRWKKRAYNWALQSVYATHTTDAFTEFLTYAKADAARQRSIDRIELMVHPGAAYAAEETAMLESDWTARTNLPVRLISYAELGPARRRSARPPLASRDLLPCD